METPNYCSECGHDLREETKYGFTVCPKCGADIPQDYDPNTPQKRTYFKIIGKFARNNEPSYPGYHMEVIDAITGNHVEGITAIEFIKPITSGMGNIPTVRLTLWGSEIDIEIAKTGQKE